MIQKQNRIRPVVYGICFYFLIAAADSFRIGVMGSILKVAALVPAALLLFDLKQLRLRFSQVLIVQLLFWLLATVSLFHSLNPQKTTFSVITLSLNLLLVFSLGSFCAYNERELHLMQRAMLLGGWLTIGMMLLMSDVSAGGRLTLRMGGNTQDQNYINGYFLYTFSYHVRRLLIKSEKKQLLPIFLILTIVLMTGSRGALLAFAITAFVQICILLSKSRNRLRNILLALTVLVFTGIAFDTILSYMPETVAVRFSWDYIAEKQTTGRTRVWGALLDHFSHDSIGRMLFGHGYGTSQYLNTVNGNVAHNLYVDNLITLGIAGLLLQLTTQVMILRLLIKRKSYTLLAAYGGMLTMCLSLSLVAYKPIWNIMLLTLAIETHHNTQEEYP